MLQEELNLYKPLCLIRESVKWLLKEKNSRNQTMFFSLRFTQCNTNFHLIYSFRRIVLYHYQFRCKMKMRNRNKTLQGGKCSSPWKFPRSHFCHRGRGFEWWTEVAVCLYACPSVVWSSSQKSEQTSPIFVGQGAYWPPWLRKTICKGFLEHMYYCPANLLVVGNR